MTREITVIESRNWYTERNIYHYFSNKILSFKSCKSIESDET